MGVASWKWFALIVDILAYEYLHLRDEEMLSHASHRWVDNHPVAARVAIVSAGALLTAHLARLIDSRYDPVSRGFWLWSSLPGGTAGWVAPIIPVPRQLMAHVPGLVAPR